MTLPEVLTPRKTPQLNELRPDWSGQNRTQRDTHCCVCISVTDLLSTADRFTDTGVSAFSELLFDVSRDQVIVGAR
jgi:hypothetical protein